MESNRTDIFSSFEYNVRHFFSSMASLKSSILDFDDFAGVTDQQRVLTPPWYLILSQFFFLENHFKNDISSSLFKEACMVIRQIVAL